MSERINNVVKMQPSWFKKRREAGESVTIQKRRKLAEKYYSLNEIAKKFSVGYDLLYKAIRRGELDAEVIGRSYRVSEESVQNYLTLCREKKSV